MSQSCLNYVNKEFSRIFKQEFGPLKAQFRKDVEAMKKRVRAEAKMSVEDDIAAGKTKCYRGRKKGSKNKGHISVKKALKSLARKGIR